MPFTSLHLSNLGPFKQIDFVFNKRINVFVGPNNSGKTTALTALGEISVFPFGMPGKFLRNDVAIFEIGHKSRGVREATFSGKIPIKWNLSDDAKMREEIKRLNPDYSRQAVN